MMATGPARCGFRRWSGNRPSARGSGRLVETVEAPGELLVWDPGIVGVEAGQAAGVGLRDPEAMPPVVPRHADHAVAVAGQVVDADRLRGAVVGDHPAVVPRAIVSARLGPALGEPDAPARVPRDVLPEV